MIIIRYLTKEILKKQIAIFFIFILIFLCQKIVKMLHATINGEIPSNLIFSLLGLGIPEITEFTLPLSFFLGLLMKIGRMYDNNEIVVMHAFGCSKKILIKTAIILAFFSSAIMMVNVVWIRPWSFYYQEKILSNAKSSLDLTTLNQGKFYSISNGHAVLFIEHIVDNHYFYNIFFAQLYTEGKFHPAIVIAKSGWIKHYKDGSQIMILNKGWRFEGTEMSRNFRITSFQNYQAMIKQKTVNLNLKDTKQMDIHTLWNTNIGWIRAELHWRITLIFTIFVMALMAIPFLGVTNFYQNRIYSMLSAILLYMLFFLLQTSIKSNAEKGRIDPMYWMWLTNGIYLFLAIILNLWDTLLVRRIRSYFLKKRKTL